MKQIGIEKMQLSDHEMNIVAHLVVPRDIKVSGGQGGEGGAVASLVPASTVTCDSICG